MTTAVSFTVPYGLMSGLYYFNKDDELPDYIMVMLANKRSKEQMTEDLVLFLGTNTSLFTEW